MVVIGGAEGGGMVWKLHTVLNRELAGRLKEYKNKSFYMLFIV